MTSTRRARRREDVAHGVAVGLHLRERLRRVDRHGDDARGERGDEREDELVRLGEDQRDAIALLQAEREQRVGAAPRLEPEVRVATTRSSPFARTNVTDRSLWTALSRRTSMNVRMSLTGLAASGTCSPGFPEERRDG